MLNLLHSLSLESGAIIVGVCSALFAIFLARIASPVFRWFLLLSTPCVLAYILYWSPVWLGADPSEYSSWSMVCIVPWSILGAILSIIVANIVLKSLRKGSRENV